MSDFDATKTTIEADGMQPEADPFEGLDDLDDIEFALQEIENKIAPLALA
jgi:hypothetical protein